MRWLADYCICSRWSTFFHGLLICLCGRRGSQYGTPFMIPHIQQCKLGSWIVTYQIKKKKISFHRSSAWLFAISLKYSASRYWHRAIPKYAVAGYCLQRRFRASAAFLGDSSFVTVKTYKEVKALWSQLGTKELLIASWAYKFAQEGKMYVYDGRTIFSEGIRACGCSVKSPHDINSFSLSHRSAQVYSGLHKISASIWKT